MSCWVVPTIAAELWSVPLAQVLGQIEAGSLSCKTEHGFVLVDVAPNSDTFSPPPRRIKPPPTYTVLTPAELEALQPRRISSDSVLCALDDEVDEGAPFDDEPDDGIPMRWEDVRRQVRVTRRRPVCSAN
jgi:hypothetical protein